MLNFTTNDKRQHNFRKQQQNQNHDMKKRQLDTRKHFRKQHNLRNDINPDDV